MFLTFLWSHHDHAREMNTLAIRLRKRDEKTGTATLPLSLFMAKTLADNRPRCKRGRDGPSKKKKNEKRQKMKRAPN